MGALKQVSVNYHGRVQGVGFRFTVVHLSGRHEVSGYVQNQPDGSVRMVAEGQEETLHKFMGSIQASAVGRYIARKDVSWGHPTGAYKDFSIKY